MVEKRVLLLHTDKLTESVKKAIPAMIPDGEMLRAALDAMDLYGVGDNLFEEIVHDEEGYYDTTRRDPIQKGMLTQRRPSNLDVLGPTWQGVLEKEASSNRLFRNNWQPRYFVLDSQYLRYWLDESQAVESMAKWEKKNVVLSTAAESGKTEMAKEKARTKATNEMTPRASVDLRSIQLESILMIGERSIQFQCLNLKLDPTGKTLTERPPYVLRATTSLDARRWLKEIQYRVRNLQMTQAMTEVWQDIHKRDGGGGGGGGSSRLVLSKYDSLPNMSKHVKPKEVEFVRVKSLASMGMRAKSLKLLKSFGSISNREMWEKS